MNISGYPINMPHILPRNTRPYNRILNHWAQKLRPGYFLWNGILTWWGGGRPVGLGSKGFCGIFSCECDTEQGAKRIQKVGILSVIPYPIQPYVCYIHLHLPWTLPYMDSMGTVRFILSIASPWKRFVMWKRVSLRIKKHLNATLEQKSKHKFHNRMSKVFFQKIIRIIHW